jgi:hypothetical protein
VALILRLEGLGVMRELLCSLRRRDDKGEADGDRTSRIRLDLVWRMRLLRRMGGRIMFIRMEVSFRSDFQGFELTGQNTCFRMTRFVFCHETLNFLLT